MIPTFAVPLALMLHGLVLWRFRRQTAVTNRLATAWSPDQWHRGRAARCRPPRSSITTCSTGLNSRT